MHERVEHLDDFVVDRDGIRNRDAPMQQAVQVFGNECLATAGRPMEKDRAARIHGVMHMRSLPTMISPLKFLAASSRILSPASGGMMCVSTSLFASAAAAIFPTCSASVW